MYTYIEHHNLLFEHQHDFRTRLSTPFVIYDIHENSLQNKVKEYAACAELRELSQCFETLDQLLHRLSQFFQSTHRPR